MLQATQPPERGAPQRAALIRLMENALLVGQRRKQAGGEGRV